MKIFLLGFLVVALTAAPSDKDKNKGREDETKKSQQDMLLAKLQRQEDQLQRLQKEVAHQRIRTKEQELKNEDLQLQLQEQRQEQERKNNEQQQQIRELAKVKRTRRFDNDTEEHLKELIRAEINPLIAGLSKCEIGSFWAYKSTVKGWIIEPVSFKRNFTRTPKVVVSLGGFYGEPGKLCDRILEIQAIDPTTTKFDLHYYGNACRNWYVSWIACA